MSVSTGGKVDKNWNTSTSSVDDETKKRMQGIYDASGAAGAAGPSPLLGGAAGYGSGAQTAGANGLAALGGDQAATQALMNPFQQQVIDQNNTQWQKINAQTSGQVNDAATRAGAFGGSRHGVAEGVALGNNNAAQAGQTAGLLQTGYGDAMNRAGQLAGLGFQGADLNANLGFQGVGSPQQWYADQLRKGYLGASGGTTGSTGTSVGANGQAGFSVPFFGGK